MRFKGQIRRDNERQCFTLAFPHDLAPEAFTAWMRSVVGTLTRRSASGGLGRESIVFETWANSRGITHRILLPAEAADFMAAQLRTHARGISVTPDDSRPSTTWSAAFEIGMSHPSRRLNTDNIEQVAAGVLSSLQALRDDEVVMVQWVIAPMDAKNARKPSTVPDQFSILKALSGASVIGTDELNERRKKLEEPNVLAVGRVMARAQFERANELIQRVESAMKAADSQRSYLRRAPVHPVEAGRNGTDAITPSHFPAQLSISELTSVVGWPQGHPVVAGLHVGTSRHLPSTEAIPRVGRVLGLSNFPGDSRPIAISHDECLRHVHVIGPTGSGKTTLLANNMGKEMADGYGVIMIESKGDLFREAKKLVPAHRLDDLIILNAADTDMPVGFNLLEQGNPGVIIDQLAELFQSLYGDNKGVWMRELLYYGLKTLAERKGMTFVDVAPLITPRTAEEIAWSNEMRRAVKDTEVRDFWTRWEGLSKNDQERNSAPLHNRIWQLSSRPELRHIIGQSHSSFYMDDVIRQNKILLVNLSGVPSEAASIAGTLIMNAIWHSVRRVRGERENFLYLDEFQDFIRLPVGADDMLAKARGFGLGLTLAHQYLSQLPDDIKKAVMANARSKIVFTVEENEDARTFAKAFGTATFGEQDFLHLPRHNAIAKISNSQSSSPVTLQTLPPHPPTGVEHQAVLRSQEKYGRRAEDVRLEITERRKSQTRASAKPLPIGIREWGA